MKILMSLICLASLAACADFVERVPSTEDWMRKHTPAGAVLTQHGGSAHSGVNASGATVSTSARIGAEGLPARNLQIELRQLRAEDSASRDISASGAVILRPGISSGSVGVNAQAGAAQDRSSLAQTALVLNGRAVSFHLGQTVPLRVVQAYVRQEQVRIVPSTVWIERGSGFSARPIWRSGEDAEVEISTQLSSRNATQTAAASTTLAVPLHQWITVAESAEDSSHSSSGIVSSSQQNGSHKLHVQMRLTLK